MEAIANTAPTLGTNYPECGYSLAGLPEVGRCPECGTAYDPEHVVLRGWPPGDSDAHRTGTWRDVIGPVLYVLIALGTAVPVMLRPRWGMVLFLLVLQAGMAAVALWRRLHPANREPWRCTSDPRASGK